MNNDTEFRTTDAKQLLDVVRAARDEGCRLVQISATGALDTYEINYTFARANGLLNYRLIVRPGESVPSVSGIFGPAFLYENEMHDLFGITVENMSVNYRGAFYKLAQRTPYSFANTPGKAGA